MTRALLAIAVLVLTTACRGGDATATPVPSPTPSAPAKVLATAGPKSLVTAVPKAIPPEAITPTSPPPTPTATPPPRTRPPTGNPTADAAIAAIEARDVDGLLALMTYESEPCAAVAELGGNVACPTGVAPGTPIERFTSSQCEGGGVPRALAREVLADWLDSLEFVYGVYRVESPEQHWWGQAGIVVVARGQYYGGPHWGRILLFPEPSTGATWVHFGCLRDVEQEAAWIAGFGSLEPLGTVVP
ncbi:MAG: hypothetical protein IT299_12345 [Dehalococcoidia bacterium]|nr:hypothetical protein [Dehalococcoidia bacterium]